MGKLFPFLFFIQSPDGKFHFFSFLSPISGWEISFFSFSNPRMGNIFLFFLQSPDGKYRSFLSPIPGWEISLSNPRMGNFISFLFVIHLAAFVVAAGNSRRCCRCFSGRSGSDKPFKIARYVIYDDAIIATRISTMAMILIIIIIITR